MKFTQKLSLLTLLVLAGCAKTGPSADTAKTPAEKPVATVNGVPISRAMFDYYAKNTAGKAARRADRRNSARSCSTT